MFKIFFLINFLVLLSNALFGQNSKLTKTWIDENNSALIIKDSFLYQQGSIGLYKQDYLVKDDTLFFIEYRYTDTKEYPTYYDYRIKKLTADTLILENNRIEMGIITNEIETTIYTDSTKTKSKITTFDKFLYQKTYLASTTIREKLEIDKYGNVHYWDKNKPKIIRKYKLSPKSLDTLTLLIQISRIENIDSVRLGKRIDQPNYIFSLTSDSLKIRKTMAGPPFLSWNLIRYLHNLKNMIQRKHKRDRKYKFLE
jgi:hypothetical protein